MTLAPVEFLNDSATDWSSSNSVSASEQDEFDKSIAKGGVTVPFPWKLHNMLDAMDSEGDHSIVQWQPHGRAFVVHDPKQFVSIIMPKYFNQTKYASFQRQLNLYGFNRLSHGQDKGSYFHRWFVRGDRDLCRNMVRQKIKGTKVRRSLTPEEEPNFYLPDWEKRLKNAEKNFLAGFNSSQRSKQARQSKGRNMTPKSVPQGIVSQKKSCRSTKKGPVKGKVDSLVAMMREAQHQTLQSELLPPPVIRTKSMPQSGQDIQGGDLLFFEGLPFRYLDHMDEVPDVLSHQTSRQVGLLPSATRRTPQLQYTFEDKDHLLRTIHSIVADTAI